MTDAELIAVLEERLARAVSSREHSRQWYAERFEVLKELCKEAGIWDRAAAIIANGREVGRAPSALTVQLNLMRHRAERAERNQEALRAALVELLDAFNPEPRIETELTIWGRAALALKRSRWA